MIFFDIAKVAIIPWNIYANLAVNQIPNKNLESSFYNYIWKPTLKNLANFFPLTSGD
jgi:hypothetical protein